MGINKIEIVIERGKDVLHGRVQYNDNLIVDEAQTVKALEEQLKKLLFDFEALDPELIEFEHSYDVYALFQQFDFLNISKVADHAEINAGLLRQYASGVKNPSVNQAKKIEETLHRLARQMQTAHIFAE